MKNSLFYAVTLSVFFTLIGCAPHSSQTTQQVPNSLNQQTTPAVLISREVLFGNPSRYQGRISPDGKSMSFRAPVAGVMNLWVGQIGDFASAKPITQDTGRGIPTHFWSLDSQYVFFTQDKNGDENWHLHRVDVGSGEIQDLTPYEGMQADQMHQSEAHPGTIIVGMNDRDAKWHDMYQVNVATGERTLLEQNDGYAYYELDNNLKIRLAVKTADDGSSHVFTKANNEWHLWFKVPFADSQAFNILGFDKQNQGIYMIDTRERNTAALVYLPIGEMTPTVIASDDKVDVTNVLLHPRSHVPLAYALNFIRPVWHPIDDAFITPIKQLNNQLNGGSQVLAQTLDNSLWTVFTDQSNQSPIYKVFDTTSGELTDLFITRPEINNLPLSTMHGVVIPSRDNLDLVSYLSLPLASDPNQDGKPEQSSPLVLLVHGGPWARDEFGFNSITQWLTNRGYSVLQVNFRASTGFGKTFFNAGNKEWAGAMHNDLIDAKEWAVEQGITRDDQVAIMGGSYGGYATLTGLTFTPEAFACGVDIVGPSSLVTFMESIPPYWESFRQILYEALGNPTTDEGLALLKARSPITHVDKIIKPLLIGQGANDPRVKQAESDQIVEAMKSRDIPVTYVLYPDEGHGFNKPENNLSFFAVAEAFLGSCLGGRIEPIGDDFRDSSIEIIHGAEFIPGLDEHMATLGNN
ncbi:Dipeptidyl aminopeptidase BIII [Paraglaciecola mesophila]|uniref:Dipeptidyl aminopeptidase BIII n=1 Tax=Paraglaciecola mesophila TaxID=197222 RepID=A0A857JF77_9ALTE|nr:S9 family peptidase [Paraglaciecola mesophila]QHJ09880.1 Dipeptidyl aminopeptidase BIII [Paraglaciecola mesophila]